MARWAVQFFIFCTVLLLFLVVVGALPIDPDPGADFHYECRSTSNNANACQNPSVNCRRANVSQSGSFQNWDLTDTDNDYGFGGSQADGYYRYCGGDCNDSNYYINPGRTEICNNFDDDCDGAIDEGGVCAFTVSVSASVSGTTVTLTATTNFGASCKWSTSPTAYGGAPNNMSTNDDFTHTATTTQAVGTTQIYYVYCRSPP